jgi:dolichyl-diphosphooligosaccharide--protein glycosyltransferase
MLVLAPAVCCIAAVALSEIMTVLTSCVRFGLTSQGSSSSKPLEKAPSAAAAEDAAVVAATPSKGDKGDKKVKGDKKEKSEKKKEKSDKGWKQYALSPMVALFGLGGVMFMLCFYTIHCVWLSADGYSAPSIVMQTVRK